MGTDHGRATGDCPKGSTNRAGKAVFRGPAKECGEHTLARHPNHHRESERHDLVDST
jgi:hypothetical protein